MAKLLVIDDEKSILETLSMFFEEKGLTVLTADTGTKGMALFRKQRPQVVILDIRLPDVNGLEILAAMVKENLPAKIIMITAFQDMETTIVAMKTGAFDYIHKPLDIDQVEQAVNRAARIIEIDRETPSLTPCAGPAAPVELIGKSEKCATYSNDGPGVRAAGERAASGGHRHRQGTHGPGDPHECRQQGQAVHRV